MMPFNASRSINTVAAINTITGNIRYQILPFIFSSKGSTSSENSSELSGISWPVVAARRLAAFIFPMIGIMPKITNGTNKVLHPAVCNEGNDTQVNGNAFACRRKAVSFQ